MPPAASVIAFAAVVVLAASVRLPALRSVRSPAPSDTDRSMVKPPAAVETMSRDVAASAVSSEPYSPAPKTVACAASSADQLASPVVALRRPWTTDSPASSPLPSTASPSR